MSNDNPMNRRHLRAAYYNAEQGPVVVSDECYYGDYVLCEDIVAYIDELSKFDYSTDVLEMLRNKLL